MKLVAKAVPLGLLFCLCPLVHSAGQSNDIFQAPIRLKAGDQFVDTGDNWGHSGPCLADFDDDGLRDLIVGDFSGRFHIFRNIGSNSEPQFASGFYLKAGEEEAKVFVY